MPSRFLNNFKRGSRLLQATPLILALALLGLFSGCRTVLYPDAKPIILVREAPQCCCRYLKTIHVVEGKMLKGYMVPLRQLEIGALNQLRNQAYAVHGNYIYLLTPRYNYVPEMPEHWYNSFYRPPKDHTVRYSAKIYDCPPTVYSDES